jgi:hypothetical protein
MSDALLERLRMIEGSMQRLARRLDAASADPERMRHLLELVERARMAAVDMPHAWVMPPRPLLNRNPPPIMRMCNSSYPLHGVPMHYLTTEEQLDLLRTDHVEGTASAKQTAERFIARIEGGE